MPAGGVRFRAAAKSLLALAPNTALRMGVLRRVVSGPFFLALPFEFLDATESRTAFRQRVDFAYTAQIAVLRYLPSTIVFRVGLVDNLGLMRVKAS